jgi:hypothetical protein
VKEPVLRTRETYDKVAARFLENTCDRSPIAFWLELNAIILEWDPYNLYRQGELDDEFSHEVTRLLAALPRTESEAEAIDAVQKIFAESFSEHDFPRGSCEAVGRRVFSWWQAQQ